MSADHVGEARARHLIELRRWDDARATLAPLLAADPDRPSLHGLMAQAQLGAKDPRGAVDSASRLVALRPDGEWGHRLLSVALRESGRSTAAVEAAQEAVRLAPNLWQTHQTLAQAHLATQYGRATNARPSALRAVELAPHEPDAHFIRGVVAQRLGDRKTAMSSYREALRLDPDHASALNNLSVIEKGHRFGRQLRGYAAAMRADPQGETAKANLVIVTRNLIRHLYICSGAVVVAGVVLTGFGTLPPNPASVAAGVLVLVALCVVVEVYRRATTRGVRRHVLSQVARSGQVVLALFSTVLAFSVGLTYCFVSGNGANELLGGALVFFMCVGFIRFIVKAVRWG